jgi:shikimate dehydrogenase
MIKTCVIGWPIAHSRSPLIHGYWIRRYSLNATYTRQAVAPPDLASFFAGMAERGLAGCNVTIPHKEAAFALIPETDALARRLHAVNTIFIRDGRLHATNTDGEGFIGSLRSAYPDFPLAGRTAVILGAGGSAKAVIGALLDQNLGSVRVINRTASRIMELNSMFDERVHVADSDRALGECDLLINATSQGMEGQAQLSLNLSGLKRSALVADLVYTPLKTKLLEEAEAAGHPILPGLGMLLHQAVHGFELWHGIRPEVTQELHDLVAADVRGVPRP